MPMFPTISLFKTSIANWLDNKDSRMGAALAFYSSLSIGPLLILLIAVGQLFWSRDSLTNNVMQQIQEVIGKDAITAISGILASAHTEHGSIIASVISFAVLLISASGVFYELQDALNTIWHVPAQKNLPLFHIITDRFLSFAMVLGTGFLLLISLVISTALGVFTTWFDPYFSFAGHIAVVLNGLVSITVTTLLFGLIFKYVPNTKVAWHDVWPGAFITALLFTLGKWFISFYLSHSAVKSSYGAAGSLMVFLIWVYYSAQILYFGAELTKASNNNRVALT